MCSALLITLLELVFVSRWRVPATKLFIRFNGKLENVLGKRPVRLTRLNECCYYVFADFIVIIMVSIDAYLVLRLS